MTKKYFISQTSSMGFNAPGMDRFQRIDKLNKLLEVGWTIKGFFEEAEGSYFLLEKTAC